MEQEALSGHISSMASVGDDEELKSLWRAVEALISARSPREVVEVIDANPALLTDRADAMLRLVGLFAEMVRLPFAPGMVRDRREWLAQARGVDLPHE